MLVLSACGGGGAPEATDDSGSYGSGVDIDVGPDGQPQAQDPASQPDTGGAHAPQGGGAAPPPDQGAGGGGPTPDLTRKPRDDLDTGFNAVFYLRAEYPKLVIEMNAVGGREPSQGARSVLQQRLTAVLDKPAGVQVLAPKTFASDKSVYSLDDISRIERHQRTQHSEGDTVTMHFLFLNGRYEDESVLGIAYRSSSIVIFTDRVRSASTPLVTEEAIMRSVLVHEAGHLLRLVNNGYTSPRNHEDPEHPGHTRHPDGVMYWAVESISVANILQGGPPDDFHADSRADLEDLKAGRL